MGGEYPSHWELVPLGELGEVNRGKSKHRPRYADFLYGGPYPFIQTGDIKASGGKITTFEQTYSEEGLAQSRLWPEGTLCITIAANIAETGILTFPACFPDSVVGFIPDESRCDVRYIEFVFRNIRRRLQYQATGSVQDNINLGTLRPLPIPLPPLPEQKRIAHILGTLDDKIELNRRTNQNLESIARAIFKSWFVDFDPVRAKMDGRPTGLPDEISALFPDSFEDSELGKIPSGWRVGSLTEILNILSGGTPSTKNNEYWENGAIGWVSAKDVSGNHFRFVLDTERKITKKGLENSSAKLLPEKTTIITARGTVGNICLLGKTMSMNQTNYGLKARDNSGDYFVFFTIANAIGVLQQRSYGTIFDTITTKTLESILVAIPPSDLIKSFEIKVSSMMDKVLRNQEESQTLSEIRDTLLPRLMSGELNL